MRPGFLQKIEQRAEKGQLRHLSQWEAKIDFFSNDYLGLARREHKVSASKLHGSTGSRLLSGNHAIHEELETQLQQQFQSESALLFNSGYDANLGVMASIPQKNEVVLYDQKVHASIRDGLRLNFAQNIGFRHNDCTHLEQKLKRFEGVKYVVVESIYSMNGDVAPLHKVADLCSKYNAYLIVDEAHAFGVYGESGGGKVEELNLGNDVFMRIVTFGKALGSHGAAVLSSEKCISFLMNFARSFIYTTALPHDSVARLIQALEWIQQDKQPRALLFDNISIFQKYMKQNLTEITVNETPIQVIPLKGIDWPKLLQQLEEYQMILKPIFPPTVSQGEERIRLSLHAYNREEEIKRITELIAHAKKE